MRIPAVLLVLLAQAAAQPTFKTGVNLVEVDVVVADRQGQPVRGLRRDDFEVFEDGKPMTLETFDAVDLPVGQPIALPPPDRSYVSTGSNDHPSDGRVLLIVFDDYHVSFDAGRLGAARAIARKLVEGLAPADQAAIVSTSGRKGAQAEFTADRARLAAAIDRFFPQSEYAADGLAGSAGRGGAPAAGNTGFIREIKARWAMDTLSHAAKALALIPHRRKAVLLISQGLPVSVEDILSDPNAAGAAQALRDFVLTAQRSNIAVYPMDPCGLDLDAGCNTNSRMNLQYLAESTGGFAVTNTNAPERGVERMIVETGAYYLLGYASPAPNDGRRHRIRVRSRVADVEIRARESYFSPRGAPKTTAARSSLETLIDAPVQSRGLTMRVAAVPAPLANKPGSTVAVGIEMPAVETLRAGTIDFQVVAVDDEGKVRTRQRFRSTFTPAAAAPSGWARIGSRVDVPAGRYQVRVAAAGANGQNGSVFTEVDVPKFTGDLTLGGLSLAPANAATAKLAELLSSVLPLVPLASPEFTSAAGVVAQVPVRVGDNATGPLTIAATLRRGNEPPRPLDSPRQETKDYTGPAGKVFIVGLPPGLEPGSYRLTVEASLGRARESRETGFIVR